MEDLITTADDAHAPCRKDSPRRSGSKARLLWRSDLALVDGTRLPGIAIVSYANPFGHPDLADATNNAAHASTHEAEADLGLALEMLRNQPLRIASVRTDHGSAPTQTVSSQKQTSWVASGQVRVYVDPRETATWAFFQRVFCSDADFVQDAGAERSAKVLTVSLQPPLLTLRGDASRQDPLSIVSTSSTSHTEFAIFAQPLIHSKLDGASMNSASIPVRLVLGRRVTVHTRRAGPSISSKELARSRSFHRQQSIGSQTLHDVFSQAGLSMPTFGGMLTAPTSTALRPDDPLPRGSISALLQARSKRKPVHTQRKRGASPVGISDRVPPQSGGPHTPGRRGEKRRWNSDRKVAGSPGLVESIDDDDRFLDGVHSPTRAIKHRADRISSDLPRFNLGKQPTRAVMPNTQAKTQLLDVKRVKMESASASPEPFLLDIKQERNEAEANEPVEKVNRNVIKKAVHTLLVREHGLVKADPDYIATYNQTCSGTWCAFRNVATTSRIPKDEVERVVRIHLSLYLYSGVI